MSDKKGGQFGNLSVVKQLQNFYHDDEDEYSEEEEEAVSDSVESETEANLQSPPQDDTNEAEDEGEKSSHVLTKSFDRLNCRETPGLMPKSPISGAYQPSRLANSYTVVPKGRQTFHSTTNADFAKASAKGLMKSGKPIQKETSEKLRQKLMRQPSLPVSSPGSNGSGYSVASDYGGYLGASNMATYSGYSRSTTPSSDCALKFGDEMNMQDRCNKDTTLIKLVRSGDMYGLSTYLNESDRVRLSIEINTPNAVNLTPLAIAVYQENYDAISQLIAFGADPGKSVSMGNNCFHLVADCDNHGMCLLKLLESSIRQFGPDELKTMLNAPNIFNAFPLDVLQLRMESSRRDRQQCQVIERMIHVMQNHQAHVNMNHVTFGSQTPMMNNIM